MFGCADADRHRFLADPELGSEGICCDFPDGLSFAARLTLTFNLTLAHSKSMSAIALSDMAKAGSQQQPARLGQYYSMSDVNSKELTYVFLCSFALALRHNNGMARKFGVGLVVLAS